MKKKNEEWNFFLRIADVLQVVGFLLAVGKESR